MNSRQQLILGCMLAVATASAFAEVTAPKAVTGDTVDHVFGITVADPYRWMEGEKNADFATWIGAQGAYGRAQLDALPRLAFWRSQLQAASKAMTSNRLQQPMGGRIFFLRLQEGREGVLMVRDADGKERVLLDPRTFSKEQGTGAISIFSPSADGRRVAVNVGTGGSEITKVMVIDVDSGQPLPDAIADVWSEFAVSWLPDGRGFTYTQLAPQGERSSEDPLLDERVRLHVLGTAPTDDPIILARGLNDRVPLEHQEFPFVQVDADSTWALAVIGQARAQTRLCYARLAEALTASAPWTCAVNYADNVQGFALRGDHLYLQTMGGTPRGKVIALDLAKAPKSTGNANVVVTESRDQVVTGMAAARDALYVRRMRAGLDSIARVPYDHPTATPLTLPFPGAAYLLATDPHADGLVFTLQGWTEPKVAYQYRPATRELVDLQLGSTSPGDYSSVVADETMARSADGTMVPLTVLHRKDAVADHSHRAIVEGYGAYGNSQQPAFDATTLEWVKAGNVYAVAKVRGGGENGDQWRVAGSKMGKARSIEDFIACARALVASGWTTPSRVTAFGGSAGGILVGGAIVSAPTQFGAAVIQSGMLDTARLAVAKNGADQFAEFGDARTREGMQSLAAMDAYLHVHPDTKYPAVLLVVGLNDSRVAPWMSGKFGASLLAASPDPRPVWFRTDADMGHFNTALGSTALEFADAFAFAEAMTP